MIDYSKLNWFDDNISTTEDDERNISLYVLPNTGLYLFIDVDKHELLYAGRQRGGMSEANPLLSDVMLIDEPYIEYFDDDITEQLKRELQSAGIIHD